MFNTNIKTIYDLLRAFPTEQACIDYLENIIWSGTPVSPFDPESKVYKCKNNRYKCVNTGKYFNIKTGTFLEGTKLPLQKWMIAIWLLTTNKKGVSSVNLAAQLGITQKSAWFLSMRVKAAFKVENNDNEKFEGICEADETFVGGKNKNRHKDKKVEACQGRAFKDKTPIVGVLQRGKTEIINGKKVQIEYSKVRCQVAGNTRRETIQPFLRNKVTKDSVIISDEWHGYVGLEYGYDHHVVDHGKKQYVDFDNPEIHSNSMEGFWKQLKTSYNGTYNWWSKKHMQRYADEVVFKFNLRGISNGERFNYLILNSRVRTKYHELTAA